MVAWTKRARFCVGASTKKRASLGLLCPDGRSALFALVLRGMGQPGGTGVCQRCGNPFHRSRRTQRYCSHRCQLIASMRRFRERHARRGQTKKAEGIPCSQRFQEDKSMIYKRGVQQKKTERYLPVLRLDLYSTHHTRRRSSASDS
jgi:hypothetical protein